MKEDLVVDSTYRDWVNGLKKRFQQARLAATIRVNSELLNFYWDLGANIVEKQKSSHWGDKLLAQLSRDLMHAFPSMKGFSKRNLELIRQWYLFWDGDCEFTKQAVSQMMRLPWGHKVDEQLRGESDAHTIGILLCKSKDRLVVDYALSDIHKPMGVSEYVLGNALPDHLKRMLPSLDDFELELQDFKKAAENRT
ncbi:MAG: DUF1016 family protein [Moraxella osloensis]|nr:DUF1016 family protein [Moraxella osloensis]